MTEQNYPYIIIEGIDGSSKSSLAGCLWSELGNRGLSPRLNVEPIERDFIDTSQALLDKPDALALAYEADRVDVESMVAHDLKYGPVVQDRSFYSTIAYQNPSKPIQDFLLRERAVNPDVVILLDAPAKALRGRLEGRGGTDEHEGSVEFQEAARWRYRRALVGNHKAVLIDALQESEEILEQALNAIDRLAFQKV